MSTYSASPSSRTSTPQESVAGTDIVVAATNTGPEPTVAYHGAWLEPGQHVVSIGSTTTALREIDVDTFLGADAVVFDVTLEQLTHESGDIVDLLDHDPHWDKGIALESHHHRRRTSRDHDPRTSPCSSPWAPPAQDLAARGYTWRAARDLGLGSAQRT